MTIAIFRPLQRVVHFLEEQLPGIPVRLCLVISFGLYMGSAWFSEGYFNPDEHFQILEFANYKLGLSPASHLAWEFPAKIRPSVQPAMAVAVYRTLDLFHLAGPFATAFVLRLFTATAAWLVSLAFCVVALRWLSQGILKKTLFLFSWFFWFFPYYHCRFSSENVAGVAFFAGLAIILWTPLAAAKAPSGNKSRFLRFLFAGLLMGFAFFFRFQVAFAVAGFGMWLLVFKKASPGELAVLFTAFCASCGINVAIDRWFYGSWVLTPVNYFSVNILQNVSKEFGVSPWWWYLGQLLLNLAPPVSLVFLAAFFLTWYRCPKNPVVWITIPFFLVHCMIAHKEFRFLFPMLYALPALLTLGADTMWPSIVAWCRRRPVAATVRFFLFLFIAVDLTLLLGYSFKPGKEVMAIYKWIYKAGKSEPFTLLTLTHSPYYLGPIPIHFYDAPGVLIRQVQTADSLKGLMRQSGKPATVALRGFALPDSLKDDSLEWKVECRSIPQWLSHFDINHWLSRVRIWTIYSVRRKGS